MEFRNYREEDYDAVCDFLIELNKNNRNHINWNWARFEWMYEHPEFDKSAKNSIGLWICEEKVVGVAMVLCQYLGHKKSNFFMLYF